VDQRSNDGQRLPDEEINGSNKSPADWPSHSRCHRKNHPGIFCFEHFLIQRFKSSISNVSNHVALIAIYVASDGGFKKEGRGPLKGIAALNKRNRSGDQKHKIEFSPKLGGPIGLNARAFVDEVVLYTRNRAPLIGVKKWRDIELDVTNSIASAILVRKIDFLV